METRPTTGEAGDAPGRGFDILGDILHSVRCDAPVKLVLRGLHWTAVVSRCCGLSSTMVAECAQGHGGNRIMPGTLVGSSAKELARLALSTDTAEASLGLAAINSLIEIDRSRCVELNAADLLLRAGKGKDVSVVGHFPFVDELRKVTRNLWVMERWLRPGDRPEADAVEFLPRSDVVAISGTTLINHTLSHLLGLCPGRSLKLLLGPTTPLTEVLFDHGIDVVSGSLVVDEERVLTSVGEGCRLQAA